MRISVRSKFKATKRTIGPGWTDREKAVQLWNELIQPLLEASLKTLKRAEASDIAEFAFGAFCESEGGENVTAAKRVAVKVKALIKEFQGGCKYDVYDS